MATASQTPEPRKPRRPPAKTLEGRENQLIAAAYDLAEHQISEGKASSQVLTHFLKLGTTREQLEQERIRNDNLLLQAKVEQIASINQMDTLAADAIKAFRGYRGEDDDDDDED